MTVDKKELGGREQAKDVERRVTKVQEKQAEQPRVQECEAG